MKEAQDAAELKQLEAQIAAEKEKLEAEYREKKEIELQAKTDAENLAAKKHLRNCN